MFYLYLPNNLKTYILRKDYYYLFFCKRNNCFILPFTNNVKIWYQKQSRVIVFNFFYLPVKTRNIISLINYYVYSWDNYIVYKVRFKHKGGWIYYLKKKVKSLILNFGFSHRLVLINNSFFLKRFKKHFKFHLLVFCCYSHDLLKELLWNIRNFFFLNIFTQRGIRLSRQLLYKKQGKVSKYMAFIKK